MRPPVPNGEGPTNTPSSLNPPAPSSSHQRHKTIRIKHASQKATITRSRDPQHQTEKDKPKSRPVSTPSTLLNPSTPSNPQPEACSPKSPAITTRNPPFPTGAGKTTPPVRLEAQVPSSVPHMRDLTCSPAALIRSLGGPRYLVRGGRS